MISSSLTHRTGVNSPSAVAGPTDHWPPSSDAAIRHAISRWNLNRVGWRGFEALPWVQDVKQKYPAVARISEQCSGANGPYKAQVRSLFEHAGAADRGALRSYFVGKLALEELSCRLSGPGSGNCDKRAAFMAIFEMTQE